MLCMLMVIRSMCKQYCLKFLTVRLESPNLANIVDTNQTKFLDGIFRKRMPFTTCLRCHLLKHKHKTELPYDITSGALRKIAFFDIIRDQCAILWLANSEVSGEVDKANIGIFQYRNISWCCEIYIFAKYKYKVSAQMEFMNTRLRKI